MSGKDYRDLVAWQKTMDLAVTAGGASGSFPKSEVYSLTSQVRRSAVSVASNIAEGQRRRSPREFADLTIAHGSVRES
jgi:four helix bundle protein